MRNLTKSFFVGLYIVVALWLPASVIYSCGKDPQTDVLVQQEQQPIYAPGWPAYGYTGEVRGKALPSEQLFRQMGGPSLHSDSICGVYIPYRIVQYNGAADSYTLRCAAVNGNGDTVQGSWHGIAHAQLWGSSRKDPLTNFLQCETMQTPHGTRLVPGGIVHYPMHLDLRDGTLNPKYSPAW